MPILSAVRNFLITLLISLLIFGLVAFGIIQFANSAFSSSGDKNNGKDNGQQDTTTTPEPPPTPDGFEELKGQSMTVLFVCTDYLPDIYTDYEYAEKRPDGFDGVPREIETDAIILVRINKETGEAIYCPIPANTQISINGHSTAIKKLYSRRGIEALREQVTALTGLPIDYHAVVTLDGLSDIVGELGGIEFHVPETINCNDEEEKLEISLKSGKRKLKGDAVLNMVRYWWYSGKETSGRYESDLLKAIIKKLLTEVPLSDAASAYIKYTKHISTDFTIEKLNEQADLMYAYSKLTVRDYAYPGTTNGTGIDAPFVPNISKATGYFDAYKFKG